MEQLPGRVQGQQGALALFDNPVETDDDRLAFVIRLPRHPLAVSGITPTEQVTPQVTPQVGALLARMEGEMSRQAMLDAVGLAHREHFRKAYLLPALELGVIEMTLPDKPQSRNQRYRLTPLGQGWRETHSSATR